LIIQMKRITQKEQHIQFLENLELQLGVCFLDMHMLL